MQNKSNYPAIAYNNFAGNVTESQKLHMGEILEHVVRRDRMGISELSRRLNVSRRTMYNWFEMDRLSIEVIRRIGLVIGHDFAAEFPEEFAKKSDYVDGESFSDIQNSLDPPPTAVYYWMDRYIKLLEKFNSVLSHDSKLKGEGSAILLVSLSLLIENFVIVLV